MEDHLLAGPSQTRTNSLEIEDVSEIISMSLEIWFLTILIREVVPLCLSKVRINFPVQSTPMVRPTQEAGRAKAREFLDDDDLFPFLMKGALGHLKIRRV